MAMSSAIEFIPKNNKIQAKTVKPSHEIIVDILLTHPNVSTKDIAATLGKSENWTSIVMNSDAFRKYYYDRRRQIDERIGLGVLPRLSQLVEKSLSRLDNYVENGDDVSPDFLLNTITSGLDRLGYSPNKQPLSQAVTNVNVSYGLSPEAEELLASATRGLHGPVVDVAEG